MAVATGERSGRRGRGGGAEAGCAPLVCAAVLVRSSGETEQPRRGGRYNINCTPPKLHPPCYRTCIALNIAGRYR